MRSGLSSQRLDIIYEPVENIADRRLARLQPIAPGQDASRDDPAQAGVIAQTLGVPNNHPIAPASAEDFYKCPRRYPGADPAQVSIKRAGGPRRSHR